MIGPISLRQVEPADLPVFYDHQRDPVAHRMAAFPPRDRDAFMTHWKTVLADESVIVRTIIVDTEVVGNVVCYEHSGRRLVGYWIGRTFWGRGIASRALAAFVSEIPTRPLHAYVAAKNRASIRVLEKCGFRAADERRATAPTVGEAIVEFLYSLAE